MPLLNVNFRPFPRVLSSLGPSASATFMARSCRKSPSVSVRWSESGQSADSAPNTSYEPKLANIFSYMDSEHTPIIFPDSHDFQCPNDATVIHTPEGLPSSRASSSSKRTAAAGRLMFGPLRLWKQGACHVSSCSSFQEIGVQLDRESVAATTFSSQSKGKTSRDLNVVHSLKDRENLRRREILTLFFRRSIRNLNLSGCSYMKQVDGQIKVKETKLSCIENWN